MRVLITATLGITFTILSGCGEAQTNQGKDATTNVGTVLAIQPTTVQLSGSVTSDPGTTTIFVNGTRATIVNGTWSATVRSINGRYQTVRVELYINNVLANSRELTVENTTLN